jgi:hypothetical protein
MDCNVIVVQTRITKETNEANLVVQYAKVLDV